jgi:hypothetical protein
MNEEEEVYLNRGIKFITQVFPERRLTMELNKYDCQACGETFKVI